MGVNETTPNKGAYINGKPILSAPGMFNALFVPQQGAYNYALAFCHSFILIDHSQNPPVIFETHFAEVHNDPNNPDNLKTYAKLVLETAQKMPGYAEGNIEMVLAGSGADKTGDKFIGTVRDIVVAGEGKIKATNIFSGAKHVGGFKTSKEVNGYINDIEKVQGFKPNTDKMHESTFYLDPRGKIAWLADDGREAKVIQLNNTNHPGELKTTGVVHPKVKEIGQIAVAHENLDAPYKIGLTNNAVYRLKMPDAPKEFADYFKYHGTKVNIYLPPLGDTEITLFEFASKSASGLNRHIKIDGYESLTKLINNKDQENQKDIFEKVKATMAQLPLEERQEIADAIERRYKHEIPIDNLKAMLGNDIAINRYIPNPVLSYKNVHGEVPYELKAKTATTETQKQQANSVQEPVNKGFLGFGKRFLWSTGDFEKGGSDGLPSFKSTYNVDTNPSAERGKILVISSPKKNANAAALEFGQGCISHSHGNCAFVVLSNGKRAVAVHWADGAPNAVQGMAEALNIAKEGLAADGFPVRAEYTIGEFGVKKEQFSERLNAALSGVVGSKNVLYRGEASYDLYVGHDGVIKKEVPEDVKDAFKKQNSGKDYKTVCSEQQFSFSMHSDSNVVSPGDTLTFAERPAFIKNTQKHGNFRFIDKSPVQPTNTHNDFGENKGFGKPQGRLSYPNTFDPDGMGGKFTGVSYTLPKTDVTKTDITSGKNKYIGMDMYALMKPDESVSSMHKGACNDWVVYKTDKNGVVVGDVVVVHSPGLSNIPNAGMSTGFSAKGKELVDFIQKTFSVDVGNGEKLVFQLASGQQFKPVASNSPDSFDNLVNDVKNLRAVFPNAQIDVAYHPYDNHKKVDGDLKKLDAIKPLVNSITAMDKELSSAMKYSVVDGKLTMQQLNRDQNAVIIESVKKLESGKAVGSIGRLQSYYDSNETTSKTTTNQQITYVNDFGHENKFGGRKLNTFELFGGDTGFSGEYTQPFTSPKPKVGVVNKLPEGDVINLVIGTQNNSQINLDKNKIFSAALHPVLNALAQPTREAKDLLISIMNKAGYSPAEVEFAVKNIDKLKEIFPDRGTDAVYIVDKNDSNKGYKVLFTQENAEESNRLRAEKKPVDISAISDAKYIAHSEKLDLNGYGANQRYVREENANRGKQIIKGSIEVIEMENLIPLNKTNLSAEAKKQFVHAFGLAFANEQMQKDNPTLLSGEIEADNLALRVNKNGTYEVVMMDIKGLVSLSKAQERHVVNHIATLGKTLGKFDPEITLPTLQLNDQMLQPAESMLQDYKNAPKTVEQSQEKFLDKIKYRLNDKDVLGSDRITQIERVVDSNGLDSQRRNVNAPKDRDFSSNERKSHTNLNAHERSVLSSRSMFSDNLNQALGKLNTKSEAKPIVVDAPTIEKPVKSGNLYMSLLPGAEKYFAKSENQTPLANQVFNWAEKQIKVVANNLLNRAVNDSKIAEKVPEIARLNHISKGNSTGAIFDNPLEARTGFDISLPADQGPRFHGPKGDELFPTLRKQEYGGFAVGGTLNVASETGAAYQEHDPFQKAVNAKIGSVTNDVIRYKLHNAAVPAALFNHVLGGTTFSALAYDMNGLATFAANHTSNSRLAKAYNITASVAGIVASGFDLTVNLSTLNGYGIANAAGFFGGYSAKLMRETGLHNTFGISEKTMLKVEGVLSSGGALVGAPDGKLAQIIPSGFYLVDGANTASLSYKLAGHNNRLDGFKQDVKSLTGGILYFTKPVNLNEMDFKTSTNLLEENTKIGKTSQFDGLNFSTKDEYRLRNTSGGGALITIGMSGLTIANLHHMPSQEGKTLAMSTVALDLTSAYHDLKAWGQSDQASKLIPAVLKDSADDIAKFNKLMVSATKSASASSVYGVGSILVGGGITYYNKAAMDKKHVAGTGAEASYMESSGYGTALGGTGAGMVAGAFGAPVVLVVGVGYGYGTMIGEMVADYRKSQGAEARTETQYRKQNEAEITKELQSTWQTTIPGAEKELANKTKILGSYGQYNAQWNDAVKAYEKTGDSKYLKQANQASLEMQKSQEKIAALEPLSESKYEALVKARAQLIEKIAVISRAENISLEKSFEADRLGYNGKVEKEWDANRDGYAALLNKKKDEKDKDDKYGGMLQTVEKLNQLLMEDANLRLKTGLPLTEEQFQLLKSEYKVLKSPDVQNMQASGMAGKELMERYKGNKNARVMQMGDEVHVTITTPRQLTPEQQQRIADFEAGKFGALDDKKRQAQRELQKFEREEMASDNPEDKSYNMQRRIPLGIRQNTEYVAFVNTQLDFLEKFEKTNLTKEQAEAAQNTGVAFAITKFAMKKGQVTEDLYTQIAQDMEHNAPINESSVEVLYKRENMIEQQIKTLSGVRSNNPLINGYVAVQHEAFNNELTATRQNIEALQGVDNTQMMTLLAGARTQAEQNTLVLTCLEQVKTLENTLDGYDAVKHRANLVSSTTSIRSLMQDGGMQLPEILKEFGIEGGITRANIQQLHTMLSNGTAEQQWMEAHGVKNIKDASEVQIKQLNALMDALSARANDDKAKGNMWHATTQGHLDFAKEKMINDIPGKLDKNIQKEQDLHNAFTDLTSTVMDRTIVKQARGSDKSYLIVKDAEGRVQEYHDAQGHVLKFVDAATRPRLMEMDGEAYLVTEHGFDKEGRITGELKDRKGRVSPILTRAGENFQSSAAEDKLAAQQMKESGLDKENRKDLKDDEKKLAKIAKAQSDAFAHAAPGKEKEIDEAAKVVADALANGTIDAKELKAIMTAFSAVRHVDTAKTSNNYARANKDKNTNSPTLN